MSASSRCTYAPLNNLIDTLNGCQTRVRESEARIRESALRIGDALHEKIAAGKIYHCRDQEYVTYMWVACEPGVYDSESVSERLTEMLEIRHGVRMMAVNIDTYYSYCIQAFASVPAGMVFAAIFAMNIMPLHELDGVMMACVLATMWFVFCLPCCSICMLVGLALCALIRYFFCITCIRAEVGLSISGDVEM